MQRHGPYRTRAVRFHELWETNGWRLKVYGIAYAAPTPDEQLIHALKAAAQSTLPQPPQTALRYGIGFICAHQGRTGSIGFVDWWENEDELHHKMFVGDEGALSELRPSRDDELTACSWDLAVINFERNAWVLHILQADEPDVVAYLNAQMNQEV